MKSIIIYSCAVIFCCLLPSRLEADSYRLVEYGIAAVKTQYVLGEPVAVSVFTANETSKSMLVPVDALKYQQFQIQISKDGKSFSDVTLGYGGTINISPANRVLPPGAVQYYPFRILCENYHQKSKATLVFRKPGVYFLRCRIGATMPRFTESVRIQVLAPRGIDRQVWQLLNRPELLHFLQFADIAPSASQEAKQLVEIVRRFPGSTYEDDILWAVRHFYCWRTEEVVHPPWSHEVMFRKVLGLSPVAVVDAGWSDCRLDCQQVALTPGLSTIEKLLLHASMQTGVTLVASQQSGLSSRPVRVHRPVMSLRQLMQALAEPGRAVWVRRGDGYRLETLPAAKK